VMRMRGGVVAVAALVLVAVTGCEPETEGATGPEQTAGGGGAALAAVDSLTVKGRAPKTGYERDNFGSAWADTDSNRCDTRVVSVLRRVNELFAQLMKGVVGCAC
jgi:hypothetical protein